MRIIHKTIFFFKIIVALGLVSMGIYFALANNQQVNIDLIFLNINSINIGLLIIIAVSCGALLGILLASISNIFRKK